MTNKQIIIDGVDVSGCIYYQCGMYAATKDNYGDCSFYCKDYNMNDCYYKQLKKAEQKLEKIKKVYNKFIPDHYKILLIINGGIVDK